MASDIAERWLSDDGLLLLECWSRDGLTEDMICARIGIARSTLWSWKTKYPQFKEALSKGKEVIDYKVENALLKTALGYKTKKVKTIISGEPNKEGNRVVRMETQEEEIAPNVTAILAWLNNRKPDQWKRNRDNVLELNDNESNITVNIVRHGDAQQKVVNIVNDEEWDVNEVPKEGSNESIQKEVDDGSWPEDFNEEWPEDDWGE